MRCDNMYKTILEAVNFTEEIRKSKFISHGVPCQTEEEALEFIDEMKKMYPDATHHCSAYIIGEQALIQRFDDDGEPSQTAGVPILEMIKNHSLTNICIVVTRYFGGIKLGAGGLIRAYASGARQLLEQAKIIEMREFELLDIIYDYSLHGTLENFFHTEAYPMDEMEFTDQVKLTTVVEKSQVTDFMERLNDLTSATHQIQRKEIQLFPVYNGKLIYKGRYYDQKYL